MFSWRHKRVEIKGKRSYSPLGDAVSWSMTKKCLVLGFNKTLGHRRSW